MKAGRHAGFPAFYRAEMADRDTVAAQAPNRRTLTAFATTKMSIGYKNGNAGSVVLNEIEYLMRTISAPLVVTAMRTNENRWSGGLWRSIRIGPLRYIEEERLLFAE